MIKVGKLWILKWYGWVKYTEKQFMILTSYVPLKLIPNSTIITELVEILRDNFYNLGARRFSPGMIFQSNTTDWNVWLIKYYLFNGGSILSPGEKTIIKWGVGNSFLAQRWLADCLAYFELIGRGLIWYVKSSCRAKQNKQKPKTSC